MENLPVVVLPAGKTASLGVARSLGRRGIPVYGIDADSSSIGFASRYIKPCLLPAQVNSDEDRLQFLLDLGKKIGEKAVLYPTRDDSVILCSKYRDELQKYFLYVMPEHRIVNDLLTKDGLHKVAQAVNVPDPQTFILNTQMKVEEIADQLPYPVIIKPVYSPSWLKPEIKVILNSGSISGTAKVVYCTNAAELIETYDRIALFDNQVIIQEVIPGEDERLVYFCFYLDRNSKPLAVFAGEKLRVLPVGFGSASFVRSFHDPQLNEISLKLLKGIGYQGLGGIEFKRDSRDEQYKLIEFNARIGMWDCLSSKCGIDIPYISYCDALGQPVDEQHEYRDGVLWIDLQRDVRAFLMYRKHGKLNFMTWLRSLRGEKDWAFYARDDWKPAIIGFVQHFKYLWDSLKDKFSIRRTK